MNNNLSEKSSKRLNELRTKAGLTMEKLANMIGVSKGTISKWEKGSIKNMRQDKVQMLANIFHVSPTYIMGYEEEINKYGDAPIKMERKVEQVQSTDDLKKQNEQTLARLLSYFNAINNKNELLSYAEYLYSKEKKDNEQ